MGIPCHNSKVHYRIYIFLIYDAESTVVNAIYLHCYKMPCVVSRKVHFFINCINLDIIYVRKILIINKLLILIAVLFLYPCKLFLE